VKFFIKYFKIIITKEGRLSYQMQSVGVLNHSSTLEEIVQLAAVCVREESLERRIYIELQLL